MLRNKKKFHADKFTGPNASSIPIKHIKIKQRKQDKYSKAKAKKRNEDKKIEPCERSSCHQGKNHRRRGSRSAPSHLLANLSAADAPLVKNQKASKREKKTRLSRALTGRIPQ